MQSKQETIENIAKQIAICNNEQWSSLTTKTQQRYAAHAALIYATVEVDLQCR